MTALTPETIRSYLDQLCRTDRHLGGPGNRAANELFRQVVSSFGFEVESAELPCLDWRHGPSALEVGSERFPIEPGPFSPPCQARAPLAAVATVEQLERGGFEGKILLVHGELAREQLMPKGFVFYNPEHHQRIVRALEAARPLAVVAATGQNPELAGGLYPFPLIEDGDFDIPSACLKDVDGERLLSHVGQEASLRLDSQRPAATAPQLVARKPGRGGKRVVFLAHIDTKPGTPGALDNASGVCVLLGLASLLADYSGPLTLELVPFNGEDYYAIPGQMWWLAQNEGRLDDILVGFNSDGAGFAGERTPVSFYECPPPLRAAVQCVMPQEGFFEGPQWPQGDHSILAFNGVPAVAVTSENVFFICSTVAHTERDTPELVDAEKVMAVARFFAAAVAELSKQA